VLLDTECWLWWLLEPQRLNARALDLFESRRHPLWLSAASAWEIAIKVALRRLSLPGPVEAYVPQRMADDDISGLPVQHAHALHVASLPANHQDPFDRLLIAQAQLERFTLLTADSALLAYPIETFWADRQAPRRTSRPRA
jgi:PIN domain nuclease of toxin-antitoxin system